MKIEDIRILKVRSANRIHSQPGVTKSRKNRPCWGLMIKRQGITEYSCANGDTVISDKNHLCLLPCGSSYSFKTTAGGCYGIEFEANMTNDSPVSFAVADSEEAFRLFLKLERVLLEKESDSQLKAIVYLYQILMTLLEKNKRYEITSKEKLISKAVEELRGNYTAPSMSIKKLAATAGISEAYFRRIYSEIYGMTPMQALMELRMKKAVELLRSDYSSIESVAEAVGYRSIYNFSKMFKKYYGVSPSEFKE